jgi:hypothetical protein
MNIVAHLDTNLMDPSDIPKLTPASVASRVHGSKLVLVVEQSMITTQWGCKICLLILYSKLTFGLKQELAVKILLGYVIGNWVVMEVLYFGVWCRPFHDYWAVPVANGIHPLTRYLDSKLILYRTMLGSPTPPDNQCRLQHFF